MCLCVQEANQYILNADYHIMFLSSFHPSNIYTVIMIVTVYFNFAGLAGVEEGAAVVFVVVVSLNWPLETRSNIL